MLLDGEALDEIPATVPLDTGTELTKAPGTLIRGTGDEVIDGGFATSPVAT